MSPGQYVLHNQDEIDPRQSAAKNYTETATDIKTVYNMKQELLRRKIKTHGLGPNPLANMVDVELAIENEDLKQRTSAGLKSKHCLGIVRKNDWKGGVTTHLYGLNSLILMSEIAKEGRGVYCIDLTKKGPYGLNRKSE